MTTQYQSATPVMPEGTFGTDIRAAFTHTDAKADIAELRRLLAIGGDAMDAGPNDKANVYRAADALLAIGTFNSAWAHTEEVKEEMTAQAKADEAAAYGPHGWMSRMYAFSKLADKILTVAVLAQLTDGNTAALEAIAATDRPTLH